MTIGIVASVYGSAYYKFVLPWVARISCLNRQPDRVTIAHDGIPDKYRDAAGELLEVEWVRSDIAFRLHPQVNVNAAIKITETDWIAKVDIDDLLFAHALDEINDSLADVVNFGYRIGDTDCPSRVVSAHEVLQKNNNAIGSCSPFRRWIWETNPFEDVRFDDWRFWIKAARAGAAFTATGRTDYIYRVHPDQISRRIDLAAAAQEIADL